MAYQSAFAASNQTHVNSEFDKHKKHLGAKKSAIKRGLFGYATFAKILFGKRKVLRS